MDLIPDDEALNTKGKTVMKWDKVKKRYLLQKVDREGKVVLLKRNATRVERKLRARRILTSLLSTKDGKRIPFRVYKELVKWKIRK